MKSSPLLWLCLCSFCLAVLLGGAGSAAARVVILHPVEGALVDDDGGEVVGYSDTAGASAVTVTLNGREHRAELWDGVFYLDLDWAEGENELQVERQVIQFVSDPYAEEVREPTVHAAMLDNCANCHLLGPDLDLTLTGDPVELCRGCHPEVAAAVTHGEGECVGCHAPHTSWNPKLLLRRGNRLCLECHSERSGDGGEAHRDLWEELACTTCHPAHHPQPEAVGSRCAPCHQGNVAAQPSHREVVDTGCQVCHAMHGQEGVGAWKQPAQSCRSCHPRTVDDDHLGTVTDCGACHQIHSVSEPPANAERCRPCHPGILDKERLHGPDAVGHCDACHPVHDPRNRSAPLFSCTGCHGMDNLQTAHTGSVVGFDTCVQCHRLHQSDEPFFLPPVRHAPFGQHQCGDCHDVSGFDAGRKFPQPWAPLCQTCHPDSTGDGNAHGPVKEGRCQTCHVPHASSWSFQLRQAPQALCLSCHPALQEQISSDSPHHRKQVCSDCHDPHGGLGPDHLRAEGNALCTRCHADPTQDLGGVLMPYVHGPLNTVGCRLCHDPHGGSAGKHLTLPVEELCVGCHEELDPAARPAGEGSAHRPVAEGRCGQCHLPHAARNQDLLRREGNALCQACHDAKKHSHTLTPQSTSAFATVPPEWPREGGHLACRSCHRPHYAAERRLFVQPRAELCQTCHAGI